MGRLRPRRAPYGVQIAALPDRACCPVYPYVTKCDLSVLSWDQNDRMSRSVLSELAYETALRALDIQERGVEQLRARAGVLLAASSVTASFLGA